MKGFTFKTILPDGAASDQSEREIGKASTKSFFAFLRKKIPESHDRHVAESGVRQVGCDSGAVRENQIRTPSLSHKFRALVTSITSRKSGGAGTVSALPASINDGPLQPEPATLDPTTSVSISPSSHADHASAASVTPLPDARQEPAQTTASPSFSNGARPTFAAFLENVALAESTRSRTESGFPNAGANVTNDATKPSLSYTSSAPVTSMSSPKSKEPDICPARHIPPPASADGMSLQPKQPVYFPPPASRAAVVADPSFDTHPVSRVSASSPTYAHPEPSKLPPSPFNAYPLFVGSPGSYHEFDPYSAPYYSYTISPASSVSSLASLLIRHRNEPDCVTAIECIREAESAMGYATARTYGWQYLRPVLEDMRSAWMAAHQFLTDCEERRLEVARWRLRVLKRLVEGQRLLPANLKGDLFAIVQQASRDDTDPAVAAWLQEMQMLGPTYWDEGNDVADDDSVGRYTI